MRVLLLNQYYFPDVAATAQLLADLGESLSRHGHAVRVIASRRRYAGGIGDGAEGTARLASAERHEGVAITRVPATALGRGSRLGRAVDYATFFAAATVPLLAGARPDVVVALSTPPLIAGLGVLSRALRGTKLVLWVMDVYPEVAVALGAIRAGGAMARGLAAASRAVLSRADAVVALDEAMRDRLVAAGAPASRVEVIDNWCDGDAIRPAPATHSALRRRLGLEGRFVVSYSGNMGLGHDLATLSRAMVLLRDRPIHWLFIGDGPRRAELERTVRQERLAQVTFLAYRPREELPDSLTAADASLVTLGPGLAGLLVPSKLYGLLAAGVPVVYVGPPEGRAFSVVARERVGVAVAGGDAEGLAAALVALAADPDGRREMGRRARALHEARFDRERALLRHRELLERVAFAAC